MRFTIGRHQPPSPTVRWMLAFLHWMVLVASVVMIAWITKDTVESRPILGSAKFLSYQFWMCCLFLADVAVEAYFTPQRKQYLLGHIFFILVSIPWTNIFDWCGVEFSPQGQYLMRFVPMIRAGYVLAMVSGALTSNRAMSMLNVYIIWVAYSVYFGSLVFYMQEHTVNPGVTDYWSALWWAVLCMTTVASDINAVTATGKALSVILAGEGLILFPVFMAYITDAVIHGRQKAKMW